MSVPEIKLKKEQSFVPLISLSPKLALDAETLFQSCGYERGVCVTA